MDLGSVNVILNGKRVEGFEGETVYVLCKRYGIDIPILCNDARLKPYSSCFVCVVEIDGNSVLQPSCSSYIYEGMRIVTDSDFVLRSRREALELLLSNHYADCVAPCKLTCPAGVDVQGYISFIEKGMYREAVELIKATNPFPSVCGRVCVRPCELSCRRNLTEDSLPVGIDYLKRFVADIDLNSESPYTPTLSKPTNKSVCIIGAGPAGLSAAFYLRQAGHNVDIYEAETYAGGWLRYGIPEYRLPNSVLDAEIEQITKLGVNIHYNQRLGDNLSFKDIKGKYDGFIITIGSQKGTLIGCEGDDAKNVFSGIDFLKDMEKNNYKPDFKGKRVAVVGGGNTAMDCCRTAKRLGAKDVIVIYRRTEAEMPANKIEIHESKTEGVEYMFLTLPVKINKDKDGAVKSIDCIKMELGEPDSSGRRRPVPVEGSEFELSIDYVFAAIGQKTDVNFLDDINLHSDKGVFELNKWNDIAADKHTLQTSIENVFAAGDAVTGPATLIEAIGQGKRAAQSCSNYILNKPLKEDNYEFISKKENFTKQNKEEYQDIYLSQAREEMPLLDNTARNNFDEVELGYSEQNATEEVNRCMECGCSEYYNCDLKNLATQLKAEQKKYNGTFNNYPIDDRDDYIVFDNNKCILCAKCVRICNELIGANALNILNRGFKSYIAPSMELPLYETDCEHCGACIDICPTGAITENTPFKAMPIKASTLRTICYYCGLGCELTLHHKNKFVFKAQGAKGYINKDANICKYPKFGYASINSCITKPLLRDKKSGGEFKEISFEEANRIIQDRIKSVSPNENAFFAGGRLNNEQLYLLNHFAKNVVKTDYLDSFYMWNQAGKTNLYEDYKISDLSFINDKDTFILLNTRVNEKMPVLSYEIYNRKFKSGAKIINVIDKRNNTMRNKADVNIEINNLYRFICQVIIYIVNNNLIDTSLLNKYSDNLTEFLEPFNDKVRYNELKRQEDFESIKLIAHTLLSKERIFVICSENNLSPQTNIMFHNLLIVTGLIDSPQSYMITKERNNASGLAYIFAAPAKRLTSDIKTATDFINNEIKAINNKGIKNLFIYGEDPVGTTEHKDLLTKYINSADFVMVEDYTLTDTAKLADIVMPASYPFETGGSSINVFGTWQRFDKYEQATGVNAIENIIDLIKYFDNSFTFDNKKVLNEYLTNYKEDEKKLLKTSIDNSINIFKFGVDNNEMIIKNKFNPNK